MINPELECYRIVILESYITSPIFSPAGSRGFEVSSIEGPSVVVNGSMSQLVLDCKYDLTDYDKTGLVIKWYFQRKPYPVYQWIPTNKPQVRVGARREGGIGSMARKEGRK